jgi:hypothetical protein
VYSSVGTGSGAAGTESIALRKGAGSTATEGNVMVTELELESHVLLDVEGAIWMSVRNSTSALRSVIT